MLDDYSSRILQFFPIILLGIALQYNKNLSVTTAALADFYAIVLICYIGIYKSLYSSIQYILLFYTFVILLPKITLLSKLESKKYPLLWIFGYIACSTLIIFTILSFFGKRVVY